MSYNRIGTPKFYIDAVLLARKLGYVVEEDALGKFYLNPSNTTTFTLDNSISLKISNRYFLNSISYCFILNHRLNADDCFINVYTINVPNTEISSSFISSQNFTNNGWNKFEPTNPMDTSKDVNVLAVQFKKNTGSDATETTLGDVSLGWSYEMPHTPDLELTQTFANESLKVQTTKGGHTLSNTGWTQPPKWGVYPQWKQSPNDIAYPARRSWSLKFSYLGDDNTTSPLMPEYYNELDANNNNRGIFERITTDSFSIKDDFLSKVMPTINLGLPFIFQPNKDVEEYAICRVNANSVALNQVANNVYDTSLDIVEIW